MSTVRFTPATVGDVNQSTIGLLGIDLNWTPQHSPVAGDVGIITYGELAVINTRIAANALFVLPSSTKPTASLSLQDTAIGAATNLIIESTAAAPVGITLAFKFENDGRIEISGPVTIDAFGANQIINKGTIALTNGSLPLSGAVIENDGVISISNSFATAFGASLTGTGSVLVGSGNQVEFSGGLSSGQTVTFGGAGSTIQVDRPSSFGSVAGFVSGDTVSLRGVGGAITGVNYASSGNAGILTVSTTGGGASLRLNGSYTAGDFSVASTGSGIAITTTRTDQGVAGKSPVYRFFDTNNGTHFFTSSAAERDSIVTTRPDLTFEGVGLNAADSTGSSAAAVYRFFDTKFGTHFYTSSSAERDSVIATRSDLSFEGVGFYAHATQQAGDSAVYRFFDTQYGTHFYTASADEANTIKTTRADLTYEGVGFYAPS